MTGRAATFAARACVRLLLAALLLASGCAAVPGELAPRTAAAGATMHRLYVVAHGWHAGIVVRAADVPADAWPARGEFADAEYLEVGWGDRAYYQARDPDVWLGLRALFWPTPSVLHVVAFSGPVQRSFPAAEIIELHVEADGFARLVAAVGDSHQRDAAGRAVVLGPGLYGTSRFYASHEAFHAFKTCNVWTAGVLRAAGLPVEPTLTSGALLDQLRPLGKVVQPGR